MPHPSAARAAMLALVVFARAGLVLGLSAVALGCSGRPESAPSSALPTAGVFPNAPVVLVSIDTLRADHLPMYGYSDVDTPHLAALAGEGLVFERAYSSSPLTLPSHLSLLTGRLPAEHGVRSNLGFSWHPDGGSLPEVLHRAGYATGAAVSAYVLRSATGLGSIFDSYDDAIPLRGLAAVGSMQRSGRLTVAAACRWIDGHAAGPRPFFLMLHLFEPHSPYEPPEPYRDRYTLPYDGEIAYADELVGALLEKLRGHGLYDDALVIVLSDHGEGLDDHGEGEHGIFLYREAIHVPLIIKLPGGQAAGSRIGHPVALVDVARTVASLVGIPDGGGLPGSPLLSGDQGPRRPLVAETVYPRIHLGWSELWSLIEGRYHYIQAPRAELYDMLADPAETESLIESRPEVASRLAQELAPFRVELGAVDRLDPTEAERLRQLGYLGAIVDAPEGPLPDPKDRIAVLTTLREAEDLARQGSLDAALEQIDAVLAREPRLADAWLQKARWLQAAERLDEAAAAFERVLEVSPRISGETATSLAVLYLRLGRQDDAARLARLAVASRPGAAHLLLGRIALGQHRLDEAETEARLADQDSLYRASAAVLLAETLVLQGPQRLEEAAQVISEADRWIKASGLEPVSRLAFVRGDVLARLDQFDEAEQAFREEIRYFPGNPLAYTSLAVLHYMRGSRTEALATLDELVRASPQPVSFVLAARTCEQVGDIEAAQTWRDRLRTLQSQ